MAKLTWASVRCAACVAQSTAPVGATIEAAEESLVASGWQRLVLPQMKGVRLWLCPLCARTPEESRVVAGLRRGAPNG
jgi:hypothetical protein